MHFVHPQPAVKSSENYRVRDSLTLGHKYVFGTFSLFPSLCASPVTSLLLCYIDALAYIVCVFFLQSRPVSVCHFLDKRAKAAEIESLAIHFSCLNEVEKLDKNNKKWLAWIMEHSAPLNSKVVVFRSWIAFLCFGFDQSRHRKNVQITSVSLFLAVLPQHFNHKSFFLIFVFHQIPETDFFYGWYDSNCICCFLPETEYSISNLFTELTMFNHINYSQIYQKSCMTDTS